MSTIMKQLKQSETRVIKRSEISLNPYNPKRHTEERIKLQKQNLQQVGYLGGITWNECSGNIIDGHRRLQAMDLYYKYDGTPDTDYDVKVEVVQMTDKEEKEQMTYMALGNTRADLSLVAAYLPDIDVTMAGIDTKTLEELSAFVHADVAVETLTIYDIAPQPKQQDTKTAEEKKAAVKASKAAIKEQCRERAENEQAYITLSFSTYQAKAEFCQMLGVDADAQFAKGEDVLSLVE